jgi:phosphoglycolate phosphatase (TIGR01487 family)
MRYHLIAIDFDGTLAENETVSPHTIEVLQQVKKTNRHLALVTGRELQDLERVFPEYRIFDYIVAENGALIHYVKTGSETLLGQAPAENFVAELKSSGVHPISVGKVIVATWEPHEKTVLEIIKQSGIELQVIFNKGAVMILPPGINKATGLQALLTSIHLSIHNIIAIGDAENDSAMLEVAAYAVAVNNALPALKERADYVTTGNAGTGVREILLKIIESEQTETNRHSLNLGTMEDEQDFTISSYRPGILLGGTSEGGKSTFASAIAETMVAAGYQFCLIDPEGDYLELPGTVVIGNDVTLPMPEEVAELLKNPLQSLIICLLSVPLDDRPVYFSKLFATLLKSRNEYGHPHWLILDEAHHLIPSHANLDKDVFPAELYNFLLISASPHMLSPAWVSQVETVITVGDDKKFVLEKFCALRNLALPNKIPELQAGEASVWDISRKTPYVIRYKLPDQLQQRHKRKYAVGDMTDNSFVFTGPENKLQLVANNLMMFAHLARGIDDDTWLYHLKKKDYRKWASEYVHDESLVAAIQLAEERYPDAQASRKIILEHIEENYTL